MCEPAAHTPGPDGRCVCHTITAPVIRGILDEIAARHPDRERMVAELAHVDRLIAGIAAGTYLVLLNGDRRYDVCVSSVKPLPVAEPQTFGACVIDSRGKRWIRDANGYWLCEDGTGRYWLALLADFGPVRVGNADPWSES